MKNLLADESLTEGLLNAVEDAVEEYDLQKGNMVHIWLIGAWHNRIAKTNTGLTFLIQMVTDNAADPDTMAESFYAPSIQTNFRMWRLAGCDEVIAIITPLLEAPSMKELPEFLEMSTVTINIDRLNEFIGQEHAAALN